MSLSLKDDVLNAVADSKRIKDDEAKIEEKIKNKLLEKLEKYLYKELRPYCSWVQIDEVLDRLMEDLR